MKSHKDTYMTNTDKQINRLFTKEFNGTIVRTMALSRESILKLVPKGCYCYDAGGSCPFWNTFEIYPEQMNGYCALLESGDWMHGDNASSELWDRCKSCGINDDDESIYDPEAKEKE